MQQQGGGEPGRVEIVQIRDLGGGSIVRSGVLAVRLGGIIRFGRFHQFRMGFYKIFQNLLGGLQTPQKAEEVTLLGVGEIVHREGEGGAVGEGEIVVPLHVLLPAQLHQPQNGLVLIRPVFQQGGVKG